MSEKKALLGEIKLEPDFGSQECIETLAERLAGLILSPEFPETEIERLRNNPDLILFLKTHCKDYAKIKELL